MSTLALGGCGSSDMDQSHAEGTSMQPDRKSPELASTSESSQAIDSHAWMLDQLSNIAQRTDEENFWLGDKALRQARQRLEELAGDPSPIVRVEAHLRVGLEESRLGHEQQAIEAYTAALREARQAGEAVPHPLAAEATFRLGLAYLRLGETQNCCRANAPESCILPIRGAGVHRDKAGSTQAMKYFTEVVESTPPATAPWLKSRWLLNLAAMTLGEYPEGVPQEHRIDPKVFESEIEFPRFENMAAALGINTFSLVGGAVADDFDGDGWLDLMVSTSDTRGQLRFFRNNGDGTFAERTKEASLTGLLGGINLVQADYNNDGHLDLYILRGAWLAAAGRHPNSLLHNNGDGTFTDVTLSAGLAENNLPSHSAAWADYDNDGDLDLYVGNEHSPGIEAPGQLFRNNGDGTFTDVAEEAGVTNLRFAKGVVWGDYDGDGRPDLFVSNLGTANRLYRNLGHGKFEDVAPALGVDRPVNSFPTWFWDFDNDGVLDLYVPSYYGSSPGLAYVAGDYLGMPQSVEPPRLFRGDGGGGFADVAKEKRLTRLALPMGSNFGDLDGDGWLDFYLGTGYPDYEAVMPNVLYLNRGGERFVDATFASGFGHLQKGHAVCFADLDHDGDLDVFEQMGGNFPGDAYYDALFENPGFDNRWIAVQLVGTKSNRSAIGARIRIDFIEKDQERTLFRQVNSGGSFGANPLRQTIGLGKATAIKRLTIDWPTSDTMQVFEDVPLGGFLRIPEDAPEFETLELNMKQ